MGKEKSQNQTWVWHQNPSSSISLNCFPLGIGTVYYLESSSILLSSLINGGTSRMTNLTRESRMTLKTLLFPLHDAVFHCGTRSIINCILALWTLKFQPEINLGAFTIRSLDIASECWIVALDNTFFLAVILPPSQLPPPFVLGMIHLSIFSSAGIDGP